MKRITPSISKECYARQSDAGRYNPARVALVKHEGKTYSCVLAAGGDDWVYCWQQGNTVYVLSISWRLGYCGLQVFSLDGSVPNKYKPDQADRFDAVMTGEIFLQADHEIESALGKRGLDLSPATICKRLAEYCY